ncbi:MAG: peptidase M19 [Sphaerobacteraceae bacterium]|nr:MAG: peptidase M19 [Sphaerobacteraceae bacterium]
MLAIDGHLDLAMNALILDRDYKASIDTIRQHEAGMTEKGRGVNTVSLPELRKAEIAVCFATVIARVQQPDSPLKGYRTHETAYSQSMGQLAWYRELQRQGEVRLLHDRAELDAHMVEWEADPENTPIGIILSMEGADPVVEPAQIHHWWDEGLRVISLAHYGPSKYAHGTSTPGPLTDAGREILDEMSGTNMILDVSHLNDDSFWEAVERFKGPLLASHSNCRELVPGDRQFTDDMIRHLIERDAVIGAVMDSWMLYPGYVRGETDRSVTSLSDVVDNIDHVCQLAGNASHAAIGTDLDGGYGTEQCPKDLDTIADIQKMTGMLADRGYSQADIENIFHGNWLRLMRRVWG